MRDTDLWSYACPPDVLVDLNGNDQFKTFILGIIDTMDDPAWRWNSL